MTGGRRATPTWLPYAGGAGALTLLAVAAVSFSSRPIVNSPTRDRTFRPPTQQGRWTDPTPSGKGTRPSLPQPGRDANYTVLATMFWTGFAIVLLLLLVWLMVAVARALLRRREQQRVILPEPVSPAVEVAKAVAQQQQQLYVGPPSNAIIGCWVALEQAVRSAGLRPDPSETSAELTLRILNDLEVDRGSLTELAALYREARFSEHPLTENHREQAVGCLQRLRSSLPREQEPADA